MVSAARELCSIVRHKNIGKTETCIGPAKSICMRHFGFKDIDHDDNAAFVGFGGT